MTQTISGLVATNPAVPANLTGTAAFEVTDATVHSVGATFSQVRTALLAGGTGYSALDVVSAAQYNLGGAITLLLSPAGTAATFLGPGATLTPPAGPFITLNNPASGQLIVAAGSINFATGGGAIVSRMLPASFRPDVSGAVTLGLAANRWSTLFGTNIDVTGTLLLSALSATAVAAGANDSGGTGFRALVVPNA